MKAKIALGLAFVMISMLAGGQTSPGGSASGLAGAEGNSAEISLETRNEVAFARTADIRERSESLHDRAVRHDSWMRQSLMPAGGVMSAQFTDQTYSRVQSYGGRRDPAIWTGAYLAAQALRLMDTESEEAARRLAESVRVLDRWWRISGDPGYLARFAAPTDSAAAILATLSADDPEVIRNVSFEGQTWHWRGRVSRDQYQGVMLGMSLAYEATQDPAIRRIIRENVTGFAEQLMRSERKRVKVIINDSSNFSTTLTLQHVVYTDDETPDGVPILRVSTSPFAAEGSGMLVFWPNPSEFVRQIPGLGSLPDVFLPSQAIQLAATFRVAMQVTEGVPGFEARHQALRAHYDANFGKWFDIAKGWENTNECGDSYHGLNIAFMPLFNWVSLETDPLRKGRLQREVLRNRLWSAVASHKNVFFAYIYASLAPPGDSTEELIAASLAQLALFPDAPQRALPLDVRGKYPADPNCPGLSAVATDVNDRAGATFIWERHPWKLVDAGGLNMAYAGVDYLLAFWLGRYAGFIPDDSVATVGLYNPVGSTFFLRDTNSSGPADLRYDFGPRDSGWRPLAGDWNGNGQSTAGLYNRSTGTFYLRDSHSGGQADRRFRFGPSAAQNWLPLSGDWDGDGQSTVGLYSPSTGIFFLRNSHAGGMADHSFRFGPSKSRWLPLSGDWSGDGRTTVGLFDPSTGTFFLRDDHAGGMADHSFRFGPQSSGLLPLSGDWNGDGRSTVGLYDPMTGRFWLRNSLSGGTADVSFQFGPAPSAWLPLAGRWMR
ncbi:hypothetical protein [Thiocapsa rosea]|uniref:VCBS repeat protein n=1 Tax=Thiocapsa rosea TaxID=69360 RepID=A0A495V4Y9_9GAMM|nr:hypothetical protein [Thiocapsa rosea]RKT44472.1 hypothetical protein BDD21_1856 [Thiocapsa rosea]